MKRYHGVSPLEQKRVMPTWLVRPSFVVGVAIVILMVVLSLFPQLIAPYDPIATDVTVSNQAPSTGSAPISTGGISSPGWCGVPVLTCLSACWAW